MAEEHEILDEFVGDCVVHDLIGVGDYVEMQPYLDGDWVRFDDVKENILRALKNPKVGTDLTSGWRDISTAPKDGTRILYRSKSYGLVLIGAYKEGYIMGGGIVSQSSALPREWEDVASEWMPLPK